MAFYLGLDGSAQCLFARVIDTERGQADFLGESLDNVRSDAQDPALARFLQLPAQQRPQSPDLTELEALLERGVLRDTIFVACYGLLDVEGHTVADLALVLEAAEGARQLVRQLLAFTPLHL
ncbi:MAG: hypothetical protein ABI548_22940 [Polyangiaceae bacterium]